MKQEHVIMLRIGDEVVHRISASHQEIHEASRIVEHKGDAWVVTKDRRGVVGQRFATEGDAYDFIAAP